jgi:Tfp pilus assembly protein PilN
MINLLPPDYAMRIRFGRANTVLRRWILGSWLAIAGLLVIIAGGWLYLNQQAADLSSSLAKTNSQLQAQNLAKVQKDAAEITGDIKVINQIFSSEIRFSSLIQDIGRVMPPGTVLSSLSLSKINGAVDLSANSKDYTSAAQIALNLNDPANGLFSKVDIVNISCGNDASSQYKCNGTFKALFSNAAQKKYLSVPVQDKKL